MQHSKPEYFRERREHWDHIHRDFSGNLFHRFYQGLLLRILRRMIPEGSEVLDIGCGAGDLLAGLNPRRGVGVDFSPVAIEHARARHGGQGGLEFLCESAEESTAEGPFDYILLIDVANDLWDIQSLLESMAPRCSASTRIIVNFHSRLWSLPLRLGEWMGLKRRTLAQNWLTARDMAGLVRLSGYEVLQHGQELLCPVPIPLIAGLANRFLARIWPFTHLCMTNCMVLGPCGVRSDEATVSVVVPARNEAGHLPGLLDRIPDLGAGTEVVFVEGHSTDETWSAIERECARRPDRKTLRLKQPGRGKGDAVRAGFQAATGDILMILDADLTVDPADLPRFYQLLVRGRGEFANGVRLVYPMAQGAMRTLNLIGNKFFSTAFTWLLGQPIRDTLCGTKALWRKDYEKIAAHRKYFGDFDPFGDFDLLFGAARMNLRIVDVPIRYGQRVYGETNIHRWRHGLLLLQMCLFAARKIKFV